MTKRIPEPIAAAAVAMLAPYFPGLDIDGLNEALCVPAADTEGDPLLTKREVVAMLKVSMRTLDRMLEPGGPLTRVKVGGSVRIRQSDVLWLIGAGA